MALPEESSGLFEKAGFDVHYCGIGKINAAHKTTELILSGRYRHILNLGTAGSLRLPMNTVVQISILFQRDRLHSPKLPSHTLKMEIPLASCGTGDCVEPHKDSAPFEMMDMEAYAIAQVCSHYKIPFSGFKYITDSSQGDVLSDWKKNLAKASQALLKVYQEVVL